MHSARTVVIDGIGTVSVSLALCVSLSLNQLWPCNFAILSRVFLRWEPLRLD